jgi:hypothetical protein
MKRKTSRPNPAPRREPVKVSLPDTRLYNAGLVVCVENTIKAAKLLITGGCEKGL